MKSLVMKSIQFLLLAAVLLGASTLKAQTVAQKSTPPKVIVSSDTVKVKEEIGDTARRDPLGRVYPYVYGNIFAKEAKYSKDSTQVDSVWKYLLHHSFYSKRFRDENGQVNKKLGDHLFLEMGLGMNTHFTRSTSTKMYTPGLMGGIAVGDWITPEHGVRLGMQAGEYKLGNYDARAWGLSLDYLMNFTAVGSRTYQQVKPFELYGIAGLSLDLSDTNDPKLKAESGDRAMALGLHMGLRGQYHLSPYTYFYVEPKLGFYSDKLVHVKAHRGFRPVGTLMAGFGYRILPVEKLHKMGEDYVADNSFLNDMFFTVYGGPNWGATSFGQLHNNAGMRMGLSGGKWFNYKHGARVNFQVGENDNYNGYGYYKKFKSVTFGVDYLLNLHNAFGGYNPERNFWLNAVAGLSVNATSGNEGHHTTLGFGGGLQANVDLGKGVNFFLEPRVDIYGNDYATYFSTTKKYDIYMSMLAGLAFRQGLDTQLQREKNADFEKGDFWSNWGFEAGYGALMPMSSPSFNNMKGLVSSKLFLGAYKWITPTSGARFWTETGQVNSISDQNYFMLNFGLDYMWNITNTFHGYDPNRKAEIISTLGVNRSKLNRNRGAFWGLNASLKGVWHVSDMFNLFLEPQIRIYGNDYVDEVTPVLNKDMLTSVLLGLGYRLNNVSQQTLESEEYYADNSFLNDMFFAVYGGPSWAVTSFSNMHKHSGMRMGLSVGKWFDPIHGARVNFQVGENKNPNGYDYYKKFKSVTFSADYMLNLNNAFAGYQSDRRFWLNALAGLSVNATSGNEGHHTTMGFGLGLQGNVNLGHNINFFVEPRVDIYGEDFATYFNTASDKDSYFSVLAGFAFRQGLDTEEQRRRNEDYELGAWWDDLEFEAGMGALMPMTSPSFDKMKGMVAPKAFMGLGKWFTPTSGIRLWGEAGGLKSMSGESFRTINVGADYMWNITNSFHGYKALDINDRPERKTELISTLGFNVSKQNEGRGSSLGLNASLKGVWHMNRMLGLFLEPQLRMYGDSYISGVTPVFNNDVLTSVIAGVQIKAFSNWGGTGLDRGNFDDVDGNRFFSFAMGPSGNGQQLAYTDLYAFNARLSLGSWFSPFAAWRANVAITAKGSKAYKTYAKATLGGDLLVDLNAISYGYDRDRVFSTRFIAGANLGVDYATYKVQFMPDVHTGMQFAVRASSHIELYAEPLLAYQFNLPANVNTNLMKFQGSLLLGVNYRFGSSDEVDPNSFLYKVRRGQLFVKEELDNHHFASVALGTGLSTQTYTVVDKFAKRLTFDIDASYGYWFNEVSALRVGLSNRTLRRGDNPSRNMQTLHFDYMADILALANNYVYDENRFHLRGFAGLTIHTATGKHYNRTWGMGVQVGMQLGVDVKDSPVEIFLEPSANIMSASILRGASQHPFEADAKLMIGTKYRF